MKNTHDKSWWVGFGFGFLIGYWVLFIDFLLFNFGSFIQVFFFFF